MPCVSPHGMVLQLQEQLVLSYKNKISLIQLAIRVITIKIFQLSLLPLYLSDIQFRKKPSDMKSIPIRILAHL